MKDIWRFGKQSARLYAQCRSYFEIIKHILEQLPKH